MAELCKFCKKVKRDQMPTNELELTSKITQFNDMHEFMQDPELDRAMEIVVKLIMNRGEVPPLKELLLIKELQALSTSFALKAVQYATFDSGAARSEKAHKKNVYFSTKEAINKLVDALKISAKHGTD